MRLVVDKATWAVQQEDCSKILRSLCERAHYEHLTIAADVIRQMSSLCVITKEPAVIDEDSIRALDAAIKACQDDQNQILLQLNKFPRGGAVLAAASDRSLHFSQFLKDAQACHDLCLEAQTAWGNFFATVPEEKGLQALFHDKLAKLNAHVAGMDSDKQALLNLTGLKDCMRAVSKFLVQKFGALVDDIAGGAELKNKQSTTSLLVQMFEHLESLGVLRVLLKSELAFVEFRDRVFLLIKVFPGLLQCQGGQGDVRQLVHCASTSLHLPRSSSWEAWLGQAKAKQLHTWMKTALNQKEQFSYIVDMLNGVVGPLLPPFETSLKTILPFEVYPVDNLLGLQDNLKHWMALPLKSTDGKASEDLLKILDEWGEKRAWRQVLFCSKAFNLKLTTAQVALSWSEATDLDARVPSDAGAQALLCLRKCRYEITSMLTGADGKVQVAEEFVKKSFQPLGDEEFRPPWQVKQFESLFEHDDLAETYNEAVKLQTDIEETWSTDVKSIVGTLQGMCPAWESKGEHLMDEDSHDLRKALLTNSEFTKIGPLAIKLKECTMAMQSINADGNPKSFSIEEINNADKTHKLGTKTVVITYALHQIYKKIPQLVGKEKLAAIDSLEKAVAAKGCSLPEQIRVHLEGLKAPTSK